ncbi:hypothetical protein [Caldicellulosiruptor acetigenus]|nr:hypothetical protein [Caldicellulosiruptor acetigenus]
MPKSWYNITADLKIPLDPSLDPSTKELIDPKVNSKQFSLKS